MPVEIDIKTAVIVVTQIVTVTAFIAGLGVSVRYIAKSMTDLTGWIGRVEKESREGIKAVDDRVDFLENRTVRIETVCEMKKLLEPTKAPKKKT